MAKEEVGGDMVSTPQHLLLDCSYCTLEGAEGKLPGSSLCQLQKHMQSNHSLDMQSVLEGGASEPGEVSPLYICPFCNTRFSTPLEYHTHVLLVHDVFGSLKCKF